MKVEKMRVADKSPGSRDIADIAVIGKTKLHDPSLSRVNHDVAYSEGCFGSG